MKVKMLLVAAALLACSALVWALPGSISFVNDGVELWTTCPGTTPIPDGADIWVYNDIDNDGPDATDPLATVCSDPPACSTPPYSMNTNHFTMNGVYWGLGAGYFITDYVVSVGDVPPGNQGKLYVRVKLSETHCDTTWNPAHDCWLSYQCITSSVVWTCSNVGTITSGGLEDLFCVDWTCAVTQESGPVVNNPVPCCTPDLFTYFDPRPYPGHGPYLFSDCITVCPGFIHTVCVGPVAAMNRIPRGFVFPGCEPVPHPEVGGLHCDSICPPALGWMVGPIVGWRYVELPAPGSGMFYYCADILPMTEASEGCLCVIVDFILPVEGTVDVVPLNESAKITITTQSESNIASFVVYRDGVLNKTFEATNTTTEHTYSYVDGDLENGRVYTYEVRYVDLNNSETVLNSESVSPSWENATVTEYSLHQNYPNPFNPSTKIAFDVVGDDAVTLTIYNATGQLVGTLVNGVTYHNGRHTITFDAGSLTSGLYFYTVKIGNEFTATKKMLLVK